MLTASVCTNNARQRPSAAPVAKGLARHGVRLLPDNTHSADIRIVWGARGSQRPHGGRLLVLERAYLGDRFSWMAIGWDGINGRADFCNADVPDDRWRKYWRDQVQPHDDSGEGVLIIGQVNMDASLEGADVQEWARRVVRNVGEPWQYRPHPQALKRGQQQPLPCDTRPLDVALRECRRVVTYSSNVGVLAAMAGKRVTCETPMSMVRGIAGHGWQADQPLGDRHDWGRKLAYCQWTPDELVAGEFWLTLRRGVE